MKTLWKFYSGEHEVSKGVLHNIGAYSEPTLLFTWMILVSLISINVLLINTTILYVSNNLNDLPVAIEQDWLEKFKILVVGKLMFLNIQKLRYVLFDLP